jgi:hypothetical protein
MEKAKTNKSKIIASSKKKKMKILFLSIAFLHLFLIAFVSVTYSWIFSTYFSDISGVNISLADSQGLVMFLDGNVTETIDINSYLGSSFSSFTLNEASSSNGQDLYLRDAGGYYIDDSNLYDSINVAEDNTGILQLRKASADDHNNSFIYFNLALESIGDNRYLFFDSLNCFIKDTSGVAINPIRVSLTFVEGENDSTFIIGNRQEFQGNYFTNAVSHIDSNTKVGFTTSQEVTSFGAYNGYSSGVFDSSKTLYNLQQNVRTSLIVKIWLEGGDPQTTDQIAGSSLDVSLKFDSLAQGGA